MMKRLSEQVRELPCDSPGTGSSYRAGWDSALEKVAQLVEANQTTRVVCGYCDTPIDDTPEAFAEHDAACERNPLAARAQELEAIERHLRGLLAGVQSDLRDLESTNAALTKRVAELKERDNQMLETLDNVDTKANRYSAQVTDLKKRVAELEAQNANLTCDMNAFRLRCESLQAQLAWTPVAKGLPTEPGWYEVASASRKALDVFHLCSEGDVGLWWWLRDTQYESPLERYPSATHYRRIELPEAK